MFYLLTFVFGLVFGSFVNVLIYRIPRGENFVTDRSKCPHCHAYIEWYDLIPLLSFLVLNGKCRNCGAKISWSYFWVEFYSGLIFLVSFMVFGNIGVGSWLANVAILEIFLILFMTDVKELMLPDAVIIAGVAIALAGFKTFNSISTEHLLAALVYLLFFSAVWSLSKGKWIGFGDGKLMFLIGLVFGAVASVIVLYMAVILGTILGLALLLFRKANLKTRLPLGAFICFSASVYIFFGNVIMSSLGSISLILNIFK